MEECSEGAAASQRVTQRLVEFVRPLLDQLDERPDKRLVRMFVGLLQVILVVRHNRFGMSHVALSLEREALHPFHEVLL